VLSNARGKNIWESAPPLDERGLKEFFREGGNSQVKGKGEKKEWA